MRISNYLTALSLGANIGLGIALLQNKQQLAKVPQATSIIQKVSYNVGCIHAIRESRHMEPGEPDDILYTDWCTYNAVQFAKTSVIKIK